MFLPLYIDFNNKKVLVIGGGKLADRKTDTLQKYGADVTIYSENVINEDLSKKTDVTFIKKNVNNDEKEIETLVKDYFFVVAATDNHELNDKISQVCRKLDKLVNNVSSKTEMNAMFGAIVKNDEFHIAVSTSGKSCKRSKALKSRIQKLIDDIEQTGNSEIGK